MPKGFVTCTERRDASAHQQEKLKNEEELNACTSRELRNLSDPERDSAAWTKAY